MTLQVLSTSPRDLREGRKAADRQTMPDLPVQFNLLFTRATRPFPKLSPARVHNACGPAEVGWRSFPTTFFAGRRRQCWIEVFRVSSRISSSTIFRSCSSKLVLFSLRVKIALDLLGQVNDLELEIMFRLLGFANERPVGSSNREPLPLCQALPLLIDRPELLNG